MLTQICLAWISLAGATNEAAVTRPNILFIYTDDQSYRTLSCYRAEGAWPWVRTPHIDRLAAEGTRFTYAYGASWCSPSRACVLTGRLPHGIRGVRLKAILDGEVDRQACGFWPADLRRHGYHTAMIGKWHVGHDAGHGWLWDHSVVWDQHDIRGDWYNNQILSIDGQPKQVVPGYSTDVYTDHAEQYIRRAHDRPWLLWLCYNAPHLPNTFHPRHADAYAGAAVPVAADIFGPRPDKPRYMEYFTHFERRDDDIYYRKTTLAEAVRGYNRLVCALDEGVGRLLRALEATRQLDKTLIVFTADQGFAWGEHGFAWKVGPYDACLRMPLLFRLPGVVARGGVCRTPVTIVDVPRTLLSLAGMSIPAGMHGRDLRPLLQQPDTVWDQPALMEHFGLRLGAETDRGLTGADATGGVPWWLFLRSGKYKYVRTLVPDEMEELYDLQDDPAELHNRAAEPACRAALDDCRQRLLAELRRTGAGLLEHLPAVRRTTEKP